MASSGAINAESQFAEGDYGLSLIGMASMAVVTLFQTGKQSSRSPQARYHTINCSRSCSIIAMSDCRLKLKRRLVRWIVTPRMHGIHHSIVRSETDSNWSSGLTLWDRLHGTLRLDVPQERVTIGVPAYRKPDDVTLQQILSLPFVMQRPSWRDSVMLKPGSEAAHQH